MLNSGHSCQQHTVLLATDNKSSVLAEIVASTINRVAYSTYGHQSAQHEVMAGVGFNGQLREARIGWYFLGNGYRVYNPRLMRFHSPDSWSPFGAGGLNAYMYCGGEPVMGSDPTGHMPFKLPSLFKLTNKNVNRTSSTSSLAPLVPASAPKSSSYFSVSEPATILSSKSRAPPLDPSTAENIYGVLPAGHRNWTPPSQLPPSEGMMTYAQFGQQQALSGTNSTSASAGASIPGPSVNMSKEFHVVERKGQQRVVLNSRSSQPTPSPGPDIVVTGRDGRERVNLSALQKKLRNTNANGEK